MTPLITFNNSTVYELTRVRTLSEVLELTLVPFVGEPLIIHCSASATDLIRWEVQECIE